MATTTLAQKLVSAEQLSVIGSDAFPVLVNPGGAGIPGMTRFDTLAKAMASGSIPFSTGTITISAPVTFNQTWNNAAMTFTAMRMNITDTTSNAASMLADYQVGGVSQFKVTKAGALTLGLGTTTISWLASGVGGYIIGTNAAVGCSINSAAIYVGSDKAIGWGPFAAVSSGIGDTLMWRDAIHTIGLRNLANPYTLNIYNTYTDAANYERISILAQSNLFRIRTEKLGTGADRSMQIYINNVTGSLEFGVVSATQWRITPPTGHLIAITDNTVDIGAAGATRPRTIYAGTSVVTPSLVTPAVTLDATTIVASAPGLTVLQTWNNAGIPFTGILENITDTASGAQSYLIDLQVGAATKFNVTKAGRIATVNPLSSWLILGTDIQLVNGSSNRVTDLWMSSNGIVNIVSNAEARLGFSITASNTAPDTQLVREAAGALSQRAGTQAQTSRYYNTYTDASNYERLSIGYIANVATITHQALGTGLTSRSIQIFAGTSGLLQFGGGGAVQWQISTAGHLLAVTDGGPDIGASGANRLNNIWMTGSITMNGNFYCGVGVAGIGVGANGAGWLYIGASTATRANINLAATGVAPTTPNNGDIWFTGAALFIRIGGVTKTFTVA